MDLEIIPRALLIFHHFPEVLAEDVTPLVFLQVGLHQRQ